MSLSLARAVADAVLYEGYLLYPYRASSQKNQARWQFGILGPPGAAAAGTGEEAQMFADCLIRTGDRAAVEVYLRFLQLQTRTTEAAEDDGGFREVEELAIGASRWLSWDEATEQELRLGSFSAAELLQGLVLPVQVPAGTDTEPATDAAGLTAGRLVRRRRELRGEVRLEASELETTGEGGPGPLLRLRISAVNTADPEPGGPPGRQDAIADSFIGTHLLLSAVDADFLSLLEPPEFAVAAAGSCSQYRCWPVLAGPEGQTDVLLISPIILYDHPALAPESSVALYDATEIDEILTLRVLTLTAAEKAEARATDPRAAAVIDRCEAMSPEELQQLHGALRNPHALDRGLDGAVVDLPPVGGDFDVLPWWDPAADASVRPDTDAVLIHGLAVSRGSRVRVVPNRRADAQDLFFAGQTGRVTSVHFDVDGSTHVGLVLEKDPAAELHEGYGRSFYFAPEELEPLDPPGGETANGKENPS